MRAVFGEGLRHLQPQWEVNLPRQLAALPIFFKVEFGGGSASVAEDW